MFERSFADVIVDKTIKYVEEAQDYIYLVFEDNSAFLWEFEISSNLIWQKGIYFPEKSKFGLMKYLESKGKR